MYLNLFGQAAVLAMILSVMADPVLLVLVEISIFHDTYHHGADQGLCLSAVVRIYPIIICAPSNFLDLGLQGHS